MYTNPEVEQIVAVLLLGNQILKSCGLFIGKFVLVKYWQMDYLDLIWFYASAAKSRGGGSNIFWEFQYELEGFIRQHVYVAVIDQCIGSGWVIVV